MRVTLAVLADYANISQEGKLNILGIFDRIAVAEVPTSLPQMHFIMRLEAHAAERDRSVDRHHQVIRSDVRIRAGKSFVRHLLFRWICPHSIPADLATYKVRAVALHDNSLSQP